MYIKAKRTINRSKRKGYSIMKKLVSLLLSLCLLLGVSALAETSFPLAANGEQLHIMVNNSSYQPDYNEVKMWQEYEKLTGVDIVWENIPAGTATEKLNMAFVSEQMPDVFFKFGINANNQIKFGSTEGYLVNLAENDLLPTYAPNFYAYMKAHPTVESAITMPDGAIYSFPQIIESVPNKVAAKTFINKTWLDKLNLKLPTTTDEFYQMLKAFKEQDPNGNGIADEIPFSAPNFNYIYYALIGAFGGGTRGVHDTVVDADPATGYPRILGATDAWKDMLKYCNKLYAEELLDNGIFTMKGAQFTATAAEDKFGVFVYTNFSPVPESISANFVGLEEALEGPHGDKFWFPVRSDLHSIGNWVITTACKNVPLALQFVDYFYTEEGVKYFFYGAEDVCHVIDAATEVSFAGYSAARSKAGNLAYFPKYIDLALRHNVGVVLENMYDPKPTQRTYTAAPDDLIDLVDAFNDARVQVCWDFGHGNLTEYDQCEALRQVGQRLKSTHIADNNGLRDDHLLPYYGNMDWTKLMGVLKEIGYQGDITFEITPFLDRVPPPSAGYGAAAYR